MNGKTVLSLQTHHKVSQIVPNCPKVTQNVPKYPKMSKIVHFRRIVVRIDLFSYKSELYKRACQSICLSVRQIVGHVLLNTEARIFLKSAFFFTVTDIAFAQIHNTSLFYARTENGNWTQTWARYIQLSLFIYSDEKTCTIGDCKKGKTEGDEWQMKREGHKRAQQEKRSEDKGLPCQGSVVNRYHFQLQKYDLWGAFSQRDL